MRVLVIGAGRVGAQVISQLRKNEGIEIVVADPHDRPAAVTQGVIAKADLKIHVTPLNIGDIVVEVEPDLIILARTVDDWEQGDTPMGAEYVLGMERELMHIGVPILPVSCKTFM